MFILFEESINNKNKILKLQLVNRKIMARDVSTDVHVKTTPPVITWQGNVTVVVLLEKQGTIVMKVLLSIRNACHSMNKIRYYLSFVLFDAIIAVHVSIADCPPRFYGFNCSSSCNCSEFQNPVCSPLSGICTCESGKTGHNCSDGMV